MTPGHDDLPTGRPSAAARESECERQGLLRRLFAEVRWPDFATTYAVIELCTR